LRQKPAGEDATRLDSATWVTAALELLAREGVDAVRVELLARRLGVTKGSFYWHFKDRDALHAAMLEHWRRHVTLDVIDQLERTADPQARYQQAMRLPFSGVPGTEVELAIRLWARRDERARAVLAEVDQIRLAFLGRLLEACGVAPEEAGARAILALAYVCVAPPLVEPATMLQCERLLRGP
jgi:AcrR family transcriptional regulator